MYLSHTLIFAALSFYVAATPILNTGFSIPLTKRTQISDDNGVVHVAKLRDHLRHRMACVCPLFFKPFATISIPRITFDNCYVFRNFNRGFDAYQRNTGVRHRSAPKVKSLEKHSLGIEPLQNDNSAYWYGSISIGKPAQTFTGELSHFTP
jgi:hypothetical protein